MSQIVRNACLVSLALLVGCTAKMGPADREPVTFQDPPAAQVDDPYPNWPVPPDTALELMESAEFEVRTVAGAGGGTTGAEKHTLYFPEAGVEFDVKWKMIPGDLDGINNAPRKELATYAIQPIFLDVEDYVVPTSAVRCVEIERYRKNHPLASPTLSGTNCVLGVLSVWMKNVTVPEVLYDEERFRTDPVYAHHMSNLNLLTFLVDHRDGRDGNFLTSKDDTRRQVFAVDNGISFGPLVFNYFVPNWTKLRVAALRKDSIDRLRGIGREDLAFLAVTTQLEVDDTGTLRNVSSGAPMDPGKGAVHRDGVVQLGLTTGEIDGVYDRIQKLIEAVDSGRIPVF
jgi:hypothetical protein